MPSHSGSKTKKAGQKSKNEVSFLELLAFGLVAVVSLKLLDIVGYR